MVSFKSMSVEELEEYRADQQKIMSGAKDEFRKAGLELKGRVDKKDVVALKEKRDEIDAQIAEKEGSDG